MIRRRRLGEADALHEALTGADSQDEDVVALVRAAEQICAAATVEPAPQFRDRLRADLMAEAGTVFVAAEPARRTPRAPRRSLRTLSRRFAAGGAAAAVTVGSLGMISTSQAAVPGELLYPVKRGVENAEVALQPDPIDRARTRLDHASERLDETRSLVGEGGESATLVSENLEDFRDQAEPSARRLLDDYAATGSDSSIDDVTTFMEASVEDLRRLWRESVPAQSEDSFGEAAVTLDALAEQASSSCSACQDVDASALVEAVERASDGR